MNKYILLFCSLFLGYSFSFTQVDLPNNMTPEEAEIMPSYLSDYSNNENLGFTTPPNSAVRTIAEWEEMQGLLIGWKAYSPMLREIVRGAKEECRVYILTSNTTQIMDYLESYGIDTVNVTFIEEPFNSVWSRDYGPWSVYTDDVDSLLTIDWIYNRPRPKDDLVPGIIADIINTPLYQTTANPYKLVHCGGNFMTDGFGTGFSSRLVLDENPNHTEAEVDNIMNQFMGINRYIKMDNLPYDGIHHIDMHMKLLDEETILVGQYPEGISDGPQMEANLLYVLSNFNSFFGTPYKIIRIPMPKDIYANAYPGSGGDYWTYTNSTIVNKTVLVPIYDIPEDTVALNIYREAMPGYKIIGIDSKESVSASGAIHCITKDIGATNPLLISHQQLADTDNNTDPYEVVAFIKHKSGIQNATLYYRTDSLQSYDAIPMASISGQVDYFNGYIPAQYNGTYVQYYIHAEATDGKEQVRPMPAPDGYFHFNVFGDDEPDDVTGIIKQENVDISMEPIFPNPASAITCIPLNVSKTQKVSIRLFDVTGKLVQTIYDGVLYQGQNFKFFDASALAGGTYMVSIQGDFGVKMQRVVVK